MPTEERINWRDLPPLPAAERDAVEITHTPSQTFLGWHDVCDRAAFLYAKYHGGAGSHQLHRGSLWHEAAANLTKLARDRGEHQVPPEMGLVELEAVFEAHPEMAISAYERDQARGMIWNWCMGSFFRPEHVIGVEQAVTLELGEWTIRCRIDLIEQPADWMLDITDYKTQWDMPRTGQDEEWAQGSIDEHGNARYGGNFQTEIYALAVAFGQTPAGLCLGNGIEDFRVFLRFPRILREEGLGYRDAYIPRAQLVKFRADVESQLRRLGSSIDSGKFQPTPGNHCARCPAAPECPLPLVLRPMSQLAHVDDPEDLERIAAAAYFKGEEATKMRAMLRERAASLGMEMVYIGDDLAYKFVPYDREGFKRGALPKVRMGIEAAAKYGHEFDLAEHVTTSQGTEFVKRKVPPRRHQNGKGDDNGNE